MSFFFFLIPEKTMTCHASPLTFFQSLSNLRLHLSCCLWFMFSLKGSAKLSRAAAESLINTQVKELPLLISQLPLLVTYICKNNVFDFS